MSDPHEVKDGDWVMYHNVCSPRLEKLEDKVDNLQKTVENGLTSKVADLWTLSKWLIVGVIGTLTGIIVDLVTSHLGN